MRRLLWIALVALSIALFAVPAGAAPQNPHVTEVEATCDELGDVTFLRNDRSSAQALFTDDGQVFVIKRGEFEGTTTIVIEDGPTISFPDAFQLPSAGGAGLQDRLLECEGVYTFEETFDLTARDLSFLGLDEEFLGATATVTGSFDFELAVLPTAGS